MVQATSKLTTKCQATIPKSVREVLGLKAGDLIAFHSDGRKIFLRKATPFDLEFTRGLEETLAEWNSRNDEDAYGNL